MRTVFVACPVEAALANVVRASGLRVHHHDVVCLRVLVDLNVAQPQQPLVPARHGARERPRRAAVVRDMDFTVVDLLARAAGGHIHGRPAQHRRCRLVACRRRKIPPLFDPSNVEWRGLGARPRLPSVKGVEHRAGEVEAAVVDVAARARPARVRKASWIELCRSGSSGGAVGLRVAAHVPPVAFCQRQAPHAQSPVSMDQTCDASVS